MVYEVTTGNIHIRESWRIRKRDFTPELRKIKALYPDCQVFRRSFASLSLEWATHNALYGLGIQRERTGSADLNYPQRWYVRWAYSVCGVAVWLFIK